MDKKSYDFADDDDIFYSFVSTGVKGDIAKAVFFQEIAHNEYNLALMDYDLEKRAYSDMANSNNGDMAKVMATVAKIILDFLSKHPQSCIILESNTEAKSKLYNRIIHNHYQELSSKIKIFGSSNNLLEEYKVGRSYKIFYIYNS